MEKREKVKSYEFEDRLVVKLIGKVEWIQRFIFELNRIFTKDQLNFSPILKNRDATGYHCFINIFMDSDDGTKGAEGQ